MAKLSDNKWEVSGEVFYLRELQGEFACSIKVVGVAQRPGVYSSSKLELPCLMTQNVYNEARRKGFGKLYQAVKLVGHLESWCNRSSSSPKVYFIADNVEKIGGF